MNLAAALRLSPTTCAAVVGSGGKTTVLFHLAAHIGERAWVTTTTHLGKEQAELADHHPIVNAPEALEAALAAPGISLFTGPLAEDGRWPAPPAEVLAALHEQALLQGIPLLIEADGARGLPLKGHAAHEPAIPLFCNLVLVVAGLSGLGAFLDASVVHRPEIFAERAGLALGEMVTPTALAQVLCHPEGVLRGAPVNARRVVVLNQADDIARQSAARGMVEKLLEKYAAVVIASLGEKPPQIHAVHVPAAGVILAAGGGKRMGNQPKPALEWRGHALVWHAAEAARQAGLSPIRVVTGAWPEAVRTGLEGQPVEFLHNPDWEQGQSTSVRCGLSGLETGAVVFLLGDQPQVSPALIRSLVEAHARTQAPIVVPEIDGQRGNPVLFDRVTFPDFETLVGDVGGRALFSRHRQAVVVWHDARPLLDVDTPADYDRLRKEEEESP